jgi:hypothetical protein
MVAPDFRNGFPDVRMVVPDFRNGFPDFRMLIPDFRNGFGIAGRVLRERKR